MWDDALRNWPSLLETDTSLSYPLTLDISPPSPSSDDDPHPSFALTENGIRMPNGLVTSEIQAHIEDESQAHDEETIQDTTALSDTLNDYANSPESTESHGVDDIEMGLEYSLNLVPEIDLDGALSGSLVVNLSRGSTDDGSTEGNVDEVSPSEYCTSSVDEGSIATSDIRSFPSGRGGSWRNRDNLAVRTTPRTLSPVFPYPRPRARPRAAHTREVEEDEEQPSWSRTQ